MLKFFLEMVIITVMKKFKIVRSSAYLIKTELLYFGARSFTTIQKRMGPITLPCGTPLVTSAHEEKELLKNTRCRRSLKNDKIKRVKLVDSLNRTHASAIEWNEIVAILTQPER